MKRLHRFTEEYLDECKKLTPTQIARFLEDYRLLHAARPTRSIGMRVPEHLLAAFKVRCRLERTRYQIKIKDLMRAWVENRSV